MCEWWAHSANELGQRHAFADHARSTAALARRFAQPFGAGDLAYALGLLHDAGKVDAGWQQRLLRAEQTGGRVGGPHWEFGAKLLLRACNVAALAVLGHHGGLTCKGALKRLRDTTLDGESDMASRLFAALPEAAALVDSPQLLPRAWLSGRDRSVLELGIRLVFSALVDADHLDTAAHFRGNNAVRVTDPADMNTLVGVFERRRREMLAGRRVSPVDETRSRLYADVIGAADGPIGVYRLPAPTGSGKTITAAGFALHHAARHRMARVIVAVPYLTITEQNATVYRELLGEDVVLEQHSQVEFEGKDHQARLAAENWDAPFVVTTTVQLFDSLFGRTPSRSRKLHRLANAVIIVDEVQALPLTLLVPILDALRVLTQSFGTTVVLASATQPSFQRLGAWSTLDVRELVARPTELFRQLRRVHYEWRVEPQPTLADIANDVVSVPDKQALVVVNTVDHARRLFDLLNRIGTLPVWHLSTRMCPAHRRAVLAEVRERLAKAQPVALVSTQLIEAGVDVDFPVVFRAMAPAESLQQAAGRANREGARTQLGRVVVFDASDAPVPSFYRTAVAVTRLHFGPGHAYPDDLDALDAYYAELYATTGAERCRRAQEIQRARHALDFTAVTDGPMRLEDNTRQSEYAFRMIVDDVVPVVVSQYRDCQRVDDLVEQIHDPDRRTKETFRALTHYIVSLPRRVATDPAVEPMCPVTIGDLRRWEGYYDLSVGITETVTGQETIF